MFPSILENPRKTVYKRPPIVTIMGHVDHGKTTLLDAFRDSDLVDQEYGSSLKLQQHLVLKQKVGIILHSSILLVMKYLMA